MRKVSIFMLMIAVMMLLILGGCNRGKKEKGSNARAIEDGSSVFVEQQKDACIQNYDPIFCDERYAGGLNADVERNDTVAKYEDNTSIILDRNNTGDK